MYKNNSYLSYKSYLNLFSEFNSVKEKKRKLVTLKLLCLLIVSKVVVKFRYWVGLRDVEYGHAK